MRGAGFLALAAIGVCLVAAARPRLPSLGDCGLGPSAPDGVAYATLVRPIGPFATGSEAEESLRRLGFGDARARAEGGLLVVCPGRFRPRQITGFDLAGTPPPGAGAVSGRFVAGRPVPAWPAWRDFLLELPRNTGDSLSWRASGPGRLELSWTTGGAWQGHRVVEYSGRDPAVLAAALVAAGPDPGPEALGRRLRRAYAKAGHKRARVSVRARQDSWGRWTEISLAEGPRGPMGLLDLSTRSREGLAQSWRVGYRPLGEGGPGVALLAGGERGVEGAWDLGQVRIAGHWLFLHGTDKVTEDAGITLSGQGGTPTVWWRLAADGAIKERLGDRTEDLLGGLDVVFCGRGCSQEGGVLSPYAHLLGDDPGTGWRGDAKIQGGVADGEGYLQARVQLARAWRAGGARLRAWGQAAWQDSPPVDRVWGLGGPRGLLALGPDEGSARRMVWAGLEAELPLTSRWSWRAFAEVGAASDPLGADIGGEADLGGGLLWRCPCLGANLLWRGDVAWRTNGGPPRVTVWFGRRG